MVSGRGGVVLAASLRWAAVTLVLLRLGLVENVSSDDGDEDNAEKVDWWVGEPATMFLDGDAYRRLTKVVL